MQTNAQDHHDRTARGALRSGILTLALCAGLATSATAQDESGAFGLLQSFAEQIGSGEGGEEVFVGLTGDEDADESESGDISDLNGAIEVSEYDLVDLHVNNEDLGNILQLLSIQSQRNIISSNSVQATVTADLYGVTFYEALDAVLHANGFGYIEKGNFIYVYTRDELEEIERSARRPVSRVVALDYLNAADAAAFASQLLTESGAITTHAATETFTITDGVPAGADNYASSAQIVIHDYEENVEQIIELLNELDSKPAQVLIEATILQTTLSEANAFGVDFALIKNLNFTDFLGEAIGGPLNVVDGLISGRGQQIDGTDVAVPNGTSSDAGGIQSGVGNTSGPGGVKAGLVNGDVAVFLRMLDEVTDVTVVSNPKILTLNRQPARVLVGTRVGYLNTTTTETSTTQTVEFLDVGTQLAVRPFVSKKGLIRLELRPQVSSFTLREVTDNSGSTVTIPDEDTTEMTTNVMVQDGQTVVLGGLFTETTTATRRQIPLLGDIPLVGQAFRGNDDETRRSEIIFMITPSLINDTELSQQGDQAQEYLEHARYGARKGLLPWSRERRVGQLLIDARRYADQGELERALAKIDQALYLQPGSSDARALRADLTGKVRIMPSRSMLEDIIQGELVPGDRDTVGGIRGSRSTPVVTIDAPASVSDASSNMLTPEMYRAESTPAQAGTPVYEVVEATPDLASEPVTETVTDLQVVEVASSDETFGVDQMTDVVNTQSTDPGEVEISWLSDEVASESQGSQEFQNGSSFETPELASEWMGSESMPWETEPAPFYISAPGMGIFFHIDWPMTVSDWATASGDRKIEVIAPSDDEGVSETLYTEVESEDF